jgi:hypothetical protein
MLRSLIGDLPPVVLATFVLPVLVWTWGRALEQMAIGVERMRQSLSPALEDSGDANTPGQS